jgi:hypothetical protein
MIGEIGRKLSMSGGRAGKSENDSVGILMLNAIGILENALEGAKSSQLLVV